jgi:hypothetical protein
MKEKERQLAGNPEVDFSTRTVIIYPDISFFNPDLNENFHVFPPDRSDY